MSTTVLPGIEPASMRAAWLLLAALSATVANPAFADAPDAAGDAGKRIYREGLLPSGQPLRGTVKNGVLLSGAAAACGSCHRRSGLGGGEGQTAVRPIAGSLLFGQQGARPAYTRSALGRALREGVDPSGRMLDALMPRFELNDDEVAQLAAYLEQLAPVAAPGVSGSDIHFATVIAPGVAPEQEQAMLAVLRAFFADKNGDTRQEQRRREIGRSVTGGEQMYRAYRKWQLHVWRLAGQPESWPAQLEEHYREQPVFALLGGIGAGGWQPVHEFCERGEIPCLFPSVDLPATGGSGYSTFYFSRGLELEAEVLAKELAAEKGAIVQVFRDDAVGRAPARALRAALRERGIDDVADRPVSGKRPAPDAFWTQLLEADRPSVLVLWLDDADIANFPFLRQVPAGLHGLYLSGTLAAQAAQSRTEGWLDRLRIVGQMEPAERRAQHLARMNVWLRARNVLLVDERVQANAFFAATIAGDALAHMEGIFSRDYFIERVEHMTEQSLFHSVYPRLSLGPGQRFASKGGYVTRYTRDGGAPQSAWVVP